MRCIYGRFADFAPVVLNLILKKRGRKCSLHGNFDFAFNSLYNYEYSAVPASRFAGKPGLVHPVSVRQSP